jgi:hypothetical protein
MAFHRRHGRLPGAPRVGASPGHREASTVSTDAGDPFDARHAVFHGEHAKREEPRRAKSTVQGKRVAMLAVAALATLGWAMHEASLTGSSGHGDEGAPASTGEAGVLREAGATSIVLHTGMSADGVRELEGEPLAVHGDLWEYGPSWIRFDHDAVVEWHSSPLRPLHTDTAAVANPIR